MNQITFKVGTRLTIRGKRWKIVNILDDDKYCLVNEDTQAWKQNTLDELLALYSTKTLLLTMSGEALATYDENTGAAQRKAAVSLHHVNEQQRNKALLRKAMAHKARELTKKLKIIPADITPDVRAKLEAEFGPESVPSESTICNWNRRYRKSGDSPDSLIGREVLRGSTGSRIDPRAEEFITEGIETQFKTNRRKTREFIFHYVRAKIDQHNHATGENIPIPSRSTIFRRLDALTSYDTDKARYGRRYADNKYRMSGKGVEVSTILERVEIDHTPIDAFLIDDLTGEVIDRVILTLIIDVYSRAILGFAISIGGTPSWSVKRALFHAIMPKSYLKERFPGRNWEWPCFGIALVYWLDNGSEFHARSVLESLFDLGADGVFIPRKTPQMHGPIERGQQTTNRGLSDFLPGRSFFKASERHDYDSIKEASITIKQFEELLHQWIIEVYHQRVHSSTGETPIERWKRKAEIITPILPTSVDALEFALSEFAERTLTHKGVELNNIQYNGVELQDLRKRFGETIVVDVRYFPDDLTTIFVAPSGSKDFVAIKAINHEELVGLSLFEHKQKHKSRKARNDLALSHAIVGLDESINEMAKETKLTQRTQKAKLAREQKAAMEKQKVTQQQKAAAAAPKLLIDCNDSVEE